MKILLLDIETAPNTAHVWGLWKQNIGLSQILASGYTMCWSAKWYNEKKVFFNSIHQTSEEAMLFELWELLNEADAVVHYNGTKFDIPTVNKEFLIHELEPPTNYKQIDLLSVAKKKFRFPSNKLDYVARTLGVGKKVKHIGHELWIQCMSGNDKAWKQMERYNKQDVKLLEDVYDRMLPWITSHPNHALYVDNPTDPLCRNCGSDDVIKNGIERTNLMAYQRYKCKCCGANLRGRSSVLTKEHRECVLV